MLSFYEGHILKIQSDPIKKPYAHLNYIYADIRTVSKWSYTVPDHESAVSQIPIHLRILQGSRNVGLKICNSVESLLGDNYFDRRFRIKH